MLLGHVRGNVGDRLRTAGTADAFLAAQWGWLGVRMHGLKFGLLSSAGLRLRMVRAQACPSAKTERCSVAGWQLTRPVLKHGPRS